MLPPRALAARLPQPRRPPLGADSAGMGDRLRHKWMAARSTCSRWAGRHWRGASAQCISSWYGAGAASSAARLMAAPRTAGRCSQAVGRSACGASWRQAGDSQAQTAQKQARGKRLAAVAARITSGQ